MSAWCVFHVSGRAWSVYHLISHTKYWVRVCLLCVYAVIDHMVKSKWFQVSTSWTRKFPEYTLAPDWPSQSRVRIEESKCPQTFILTGSRGTNITGILRLIFPSSVWVVGLSPGIKISYFHESFSKQTTYPLYSSIHFKNSKHFIAIFISWLHIFNSRKSKSSTRQTIKTVKMYFIFIQQTTWQRGVETLTGLWAPYLLHMINM